ncbi:hypothetical protein RugamoR64_51280 [Duganella rhizosphaerae]|uniref:hypothetical protein n=1 Tax=Duganella rhizosphaerae TaxID=2885763 RepID=UPI0030E92CBD
MIINTFGIWDGAQTAHIAYVNACMDAYIQDWFSKPILQSLPQRRAVLEFITGSRHIIASPYRTDFSCLIAHFEKKFPKKTDLRTKSMQLFKSIFKYEEFSDKDTIGWNAYRLCEKMKWKVCPYCHIHGTEMAAPDLLDDEYRPQLDHYYSQSRYPFLGLSLGNLIPCCAQCNGTGFKHNKNFYLIPHLHPHADNESIRFALSITDPSKQDDVLAYNMRDCRELYRITLCVDRDDKKSKNALKTFKLSSRYQPYIGHALKIARDIKRESTNMNQSSRSQMCNQLGLPRDVDVLSFDPNDSEEYKHAPTGKMERDIYHASVKRWS